MGNRNTASVLILLGLWTTPVGACGFQAHYFGGFVGFDLEGGWWVWDGVASFDTLRGDELDQDSWAALLRFDDTGLVTDYRPVAHEDLASAYLKQPVHRRIDIGDGMRTPVREAPEELDLRHVVTDLLRDRQIHQGEPIRQNELNVDQATEFGCERPPMVLRYGQAESGLLQPEGPHAREPLDGEEAPGGQGVHRGTRLLKDKRTGLVIAELAYGDSGHPHDQSRTMTTLLSSGSQAPQDPADLVTACTTASSNIDASPPTWLKVRVTSAPVFLRAAPDLQAQPVRALGPATWVLVFPQQGPDSIWGWVPNSGWLLLDETHAAEDHCVPLAPSITYQPCGPG